MADFHKHQSWGRTRRPKNVTGKDGWAMEATVPNAASAAATPAPNGTTDNDLVHTISSVQLFSPANGTIRFTMGADPEAGATALSAGMRVQINAGPDWLRQRAFRIVATTPAGGAPANSVTIILDEEAAHQAKFLSAADLVVAGLMRRRTILGYSTENQRFLHLTCIVDAVNGVHVYNYAVGKWVELQEQGFDPMVAATADDHRIRSVPITLAAGQHRIIDIMGADRVYVECPNAHEVYGATSTF